MLDIFLETNEKGNERWNIDHEPTNQSYSYLIFLTDSFHKYTVWKSHSYIYPFHCKMQLALAYNGALLDGRLMTSRGSIVQSTFIGSLKKRVEELLSYSPSLKNNFCNYAKLGKWPVEEAASIILSWYLQWYDVPSHSVIKRAVEKIKPCRKSSSSVVPLLRLLLPRTHIDAISKIDKLWFA